MQKQRKAVMRVICMLLMLLTVFSVAAVTVSAVVSNDSGVYYKVVGQSAGSFYYYGYDYVNKKDVTWSSGDPLEFTFTGGFKVEYAGSTYYAACASAGIARPDSNTTSNGLLTLRDPYTDQYNNSAKYGYKFTGENNGEARKIDLDFIFACWYYAYKRFPKGYNPGGGQAITWDNCLMQEVVSIVYRYQWDTRVINKKIYPDDVISSVAEYNNLPSNPKLHSVHGDYYTLLNVVDYILQDALVDAEGLWKNNKVKYTSDKLTAYYTDANGKTHTLQLVDMNHVTNSRRAQNLFLFRPNSGTTQPCSIEVYKQDENNKPLPGAFFDLYKEMPTGSKNYVNLGMNLETDSNGKVMWTNIGPGNYYVVETVAPEGYQLDPTPKYIDNLTGSETRTVTITNEKIESYTIRVRKTDENGNDLTGAVFALYQSVNGTYRYVSQATTIFGIAGWNELEAGGYYVVETTAPGGYELDTTRHYVTLPPANDSTTVTLTIMNKKIVKTGSWTPNVNKVYEGHDLEDEQFEFQLWKNSYTGSSGNLLQTVRNRADGSIPFEPIQYTSADIGKEYTYYVRESSPSINGVLVKDSHVVKYTIKISDPGTGTELTIETSTSGSTTFTNKGWDAKYGAIGVMKVDQFGNPVADVTFDLYNDDTGFYLGTITTDESGVATYGIGGNGGYTLDAGQSYAMREVSAPDGYIVDSATWYDATVIAGQLTYVNNGEPVLNPTATGSWAPNVNKVLNGRELQDSEFTFVLEKDGEILQAVKNTADGSIPFVTVEYTASDIGKIYTYTIRELIGEDGTVIYDSHTVTYTVKVSYSGTGTELTIETSTSGSTTFTNYIPIGNWTPDVDKVLEGRELQDGEFTFVLEKDGVELQRVTNLADGSISFEAIEYTAADIGRIYTYTIRELTGEDSTVIYDDRTVTYTVKVSYSGTGMELTIEDSTSDSTTFTNYVPIESWTPDVDKVLEGRDLTEGEFTFVLEKEGETEPLQTVQNAADGSIPFAAIYFDLTDAGEHKYTIRELPGDDQIIYDDHKVTYTVTVAQSGTKLDVSAAAEGDKTFTNRLSTGKIEILKTDPYGTILSGAEFLLEWSEDGNEWFPVTAATELVMGGCTAAGLIDGKLITDEDGRAVFDGLYPTLYYRLTETKAPEGMQLLATCAFEGLLSDREDLTVSLRVVNSPKFTIPNTGDRGFGYLMLAVPALCCIAAAILIAATEKRKKA